MRSYEIPRQREERDSCLVRRPAHRNHVQGRSQKLLTTGFFYESHAQASRVPRQPVATLTHLIRHIMDIHHLVVRLPDARGAAGGLAGMEAALRI